MKYPDVLVFDDLMDPVLVQEAYELIVGTGGRSYEFVRWDDVQYDEDPTLQACKRLAANVWHEQLSWLLEQPMAGFEIWHNVMYEGGDLHKHIDQDEKSKELVTPTWSSALYLGPENNFIGGALQLYTHGDRKTISVPFQKNRVVVFNSKFPHRVNQVVGLNPPDKPRVALTCAVWDHEIEPHPERY